MWAEDQPNGWEELKKRLTSSPTLSYPDTNTDFILDTDARDQGIGVVLSQVINGEEMVITYGTRVLNKQERRYCVKRISCCGAFLLKTYRHYLVGRKFVLRTDHASLRWLRSFKHQEGQAAPWLEVLDTYDFDLVHRSGKSTRMLMPFLEVLTCNVVEIMRDRKLGPDERKKLIKSNQ